MARHELPKEMDHRHHSDIYAILDFIDESVKKRTLLGYESDPIYGEDPLAGSRLNILKDEIVTAAIVFENGKLAEACQHLLNAYLSTDGLGQAPDLVYGLAAAELAKKITSMRKEVIGCE